MGKLNKNIRAKAKAAVAKVSQQQQQLKKSLTKSEDKLELLLHKTKDTKFKKATTSKKEKFRQKHKNLMNKFAEMKKKRKEENARKQREKTAIIGDLKPLKDSLPSLDELIKFSKNANSLKTGLDKTPNVEEAPKLTAKQKIAKKRQQFARKVNSYEALLKDPDFKKNPRDAIAYHIQQQHGLLNE